MWFTPSALLPAARTRRLRWFGRKQPRASGPCRPCALPRGAAGPRPHTLRGARKQPRFARGAGFKQKHTKGPRRPESQVTAALPRPQLLAESFLWKGWSKPKWERASACKAPGVCQAVTFIQSLLNSFCFYCSWQHLQRLLLKNENVTARRAYKC